MKRFREKIPYLLDAATFINFKRFRFFKGGVSLFGGGV